MTLVESLIRILVDVSTAILVDVRVVRTRYVETVATVFVDVSKTVLVESGGSSVLVTCSVIVAVVNRVEVTAGAGPGLFGIGAPVTAPPASGPPAPHFPKFGLQ